MPIQPHTLESDFPQYTDTIRHLREENLAFRSDSEAYHRLDKEIRGLEERGVATDDAHFTELKVRRARMKDQLYRRIQSSAGEH